MVMRINGHYIYLLIIHKVYKSPKYSHHDQVQQEKKHLYDFPWKIGGSIREGKIRWLQRQSHFDRSQGHPTPKPPPEPASGCVGGSKPPPEPASGCVATTQSHHPESSLAKVLSRNSGVSVKIEVQKIFVLE